MWAFHIFGHGHKDIYVVSNAPLFIVALDLDNEPDSGGRRGLHDNIYGKERFDTNVKSIAHKLEFAIGRDEGHESFILKSTQSDTLMELYVVELHCLVL